MTTRNKVWFSIAVLTNPFFGKVLVQMSSSFGLIFLRSIFLCAMFAVGAVRPAAADDFETCDNQSGDVAIAACTRGITSGEYSGDKLADIYIDRAIEYANKGDYDRAIVDYGDAIKTNSKYQRVYKSRGDTYRKKGDRDKAIADYDEWLRLDSDRANALHSRGEWYTGFGWYDLALVDLNEALSLKPNDAPTLDGRGRNYLFMKDFRKAILDFDAAVRIGEFYNSLYARGWAKLQVGDTRGGNKDIANVKRVRTPEKIAEYEEYYGIKK